MQIRRLEGSRWDEVAALWDVASAGDPLGEPLTAQYLRELTQSDRYVADASVVADEHGAAVGVAWGVIEPEPGFGIDDYRHAAAQLVGVVVHPDHRGRGVARALLSRVEIAMRERNHLVIDCTPYGVTVDAPAHRFLGACGYNAVLHIVDIYHDLARFEFTSEVAQRRRRLEGEGVTFRWLEPSDQDDLLGLWREFLPYWAMDEHDEESLRQFRQNAGHEAVGWRYALAEAGGRLVGFVGPIWANPGGEGSFSSPGVIPAYRSRGIASVLLYLALDYMKTEGTRSTTYTTSGMNPAQFLYLRAGATVRSVGCNWYRKLLVGSG